MAIVKPTAEDARYVHMNGDSTCADCNKEILPGDDYFSWAFGMAAATFLNLHVECFTDWFPRVLPDYYKATRGMVLVPQEDKQ